LLLSLPHALPQRTPFYLYGYSAGDIGAAFPIVIIVCGLETLVTVSDSVPEIVHDLVPVDTYQEVSNSVLESYFIFTAGPFSDVTCALGKFELFEDEACLIPWT